MSDFFVDYIKEEMCDEHNPIPEAREDRNHDFQSSQPSESLAHHVDVDTLVLLAQDEIRTVEHPIRPQWNQFQWDSDQWGLGDPVLKTKCQEGKEDILRPGTPSEACLSTSSDSDADLWSSVGVSSDKSSISAFGIDALLAESEDLCRQPDDSLLMLESPLPDLLPLSGGDAQDQNEVLSFAESAGILEHDQVPVASPDFKTRPETQNSHLKQKTLARAGKTIRKVPMRPPCNRVDHTVNEQQLKSSRFHVGGSKHTPNDSFHYPLKAKATLLDFVPPVSVPWAITNRRNTSSLPETLSHHHTVSSSRNPSSLAGTTGYNLRTRSSVGETKLSKARLRGKTPPLSTTREHQRQSVRNTHPPRKRPATSMPGDFAARACSSETSTRFGKRSFELSDQDTDSDTQPPQKRQRGKSEQGPPKRSRKLRLDNILSEAGFTIRNNALRCSCRMTFSRSWEAKRHWMNASTHKVQRLHEGDDSGLLENYCIKCKQFLARKDSLARHIPKCGMRRKRGCQIRMDPAGNLRLADG